MKASDFVEWFLRRWKEKIKAGKVKVYSDHIIYKGSEIYFDDFSQYRSRIIKTLLALAYSIPNCQAFSLRIYYHPSNSNPLNSDRSLNTDWLYDIELVDGQGHLVFQSPLPKKDYHVLEIPICQVADELSFVFSFEGISGRRS